MNESKIQTQIDTRCPCFSKSLSECDCEFNQEPPKLKSLLREAYVPPKDFERVTAPNKPDSFAQVGD